MKNKNQTSTNLNVSYADRQISKAEKMTDREKVMKWLDSIGEFDEACRAEVIEKCKTDKEARKYFVGRYAEVEVITERSAIMQYMGGLSREQADAEAWNEFAGTPKKQVDAGHGII